MGINVLNRLSTYGHRDLGPSSGWSIAMANLLLAVLVGLWLLAATVFAQVRPDARILPRWPVARVHVIALLGWLASFVAIAALWAA